MCPESIVKRFWSKVDRSAGSTACWPWIGGKKPKGYGNFCLERRGQSYNKTVIAHRFAYELTFGPIAPGLLACHTCDNPSCCNPSHIFIGDNRTNMQDAVSKGRKDFSEMARKAGQKTTNGTKIAKLTNSEVVMLLNEYETGALLADLALKYDINASTVSEIVRGKRYKWVSEVHTNRVSPAERYNAKRRAKT